MKTDEQTNAPPPLTPLRAYNPDVLSCIANLSNDEVFTPPELANRMLDMLPQKLFSDPSATFLDPACKSGVFLREIAKRLIKGLEMEIPDLQRRLDHIFRKQLFGLAITELTSLLSRRSLYCSKFPNGKYSVVRFPDEQGNIRFRRVEHNWEDGRCRFCGASQSQWDRGDTLETHAYEWIHIDNPKDLFHMKFDVIISNPPYQMDDGGNGVSAAPIFHRFVEQAKKLGPKYLSMIIPARWYAGGKGLDDFRRSMLDDHRIRQLIDYESSKDCFYGVNIAGGICYFLWDRDWKGKCQIQNMLGDTSSISVRALDEFPIFIRSNTAVSIVRKVLASGIDPYSEHAYARNPFGFATNYRGRTKRAVGDIELLTSVGIQFVKRSDVTKNADAIDRWKVLIGRLVPSNGELDVDPKEGYRVLTDTRIIGPGTINTETYLDIGVFKTKRESENFDKYLKSKFARFLVRQAISSLNVTRDSFRFVPMQDFTKPWTDAELYKKYGLDKEEIAFIESMIKPME